jgi:hypothetical protein
VTPSRGLRLLGAVIAAGMLAAGAWIAGGNAYAAKREREAARMLEKTFGTRAALEGKYASTETNAEARRAEELAKGIGCELGPRPKGSPAANAGGGLSESERAAVGDYVAAQLVRPDDSVSAPPPDVAAILSRHRAALTAFEEFLVAASPLRWSCDPATSGRGDRVPSLAGHMRTQRLLAADALAAASRGDSAAAARTLEASWKLNDALLARPEFVSHLIGMASARLEAGVLRKVSASSEVWVPRLDAMGRRGPLVDALVLEHGDPRAFAGRIRSTLAREADGGGNRLVSWLREPSERLWSAEFSESWAVEIAKLRDAPTFEAGKPAGERPGGVTGFVVGLAMPNVRNTFERADRLALDAELTAKILTLQELRRARGTWPEASAEIADSRFPGLSWSYAVSGGAMTISLSRPLPEAKMPFVLPTTFSSRVQAP